MEREPLLSGGKLPRSSSWNRRFPSPTGLNVVLLPSLPRACVFLTPVYFLELFSRDGDTDAEIFPRIRCQTSISSPPFSSSIDFPLRVRHCGQRLLTTLFMQPCSFFSSPTPLLPTVHLFSHCLPLTNAWLQFTAHNKVAHGLQMMMMMRELSA